jgi:predicted nuclease with TOPRIM domain
LARKILLAGLITLEEARTNADVTLEEGSPLASLLTLSNERGGGSSRYQPTQERLEKLEAKNARLEKAMRVLVGDSAAPIKESDDGVEEHWSKTMFGLAKDNKDDELKSACRAMLSFDDDKI